MDGNNAKKILKMAIMIYLASFLIINWSDISWIFNYKEVSGLVSDFFNPYPSIDAVEMDAYFSNHNREITTHQGKTGVLKNVQAPHTDKQNTIEIPKISISVPIVFPTTTDNAQLRKELDKGVVYYPGSVYPGQTGQIVILGHSAPPGWPKIKHDWVFSDLNKLAEGDNILIDFNGKQYTYIVKQKTIIQRGADIPAGSSSSDNNVLTLISCWPPGKNYQRIVVQAELLGG